MKKIVYAALLGIFAIGCTAEKPEGRWPEIELSAAIEGSGTSVSRAVVDGSGDVSGFTFLRKDITGTTAPDDFGGGTILDATRQASGDIVFSGGAPTYKINNDNAFFVAYYPTVAPVASSVTWGIDGKTDILLTNAVYDAGNYTTTNSGSMTFEHQLAQLEIICKASPTASLGVVRAAWGQITKIELVNTPEECVYAFSNPTVTTFSTVKKDLPLVDKDYTSDFAQMEIPDQNNTTVTAAGMFAPGDGTTPVSINIYTEQETSGKQISIQLKDNSQTNQGFAKGMKHTVTLSFSANDKNIEIKSTTITPWAQGYSGDGNLSK